MKKRFLKILLINFLRVLILCCLSFTQGCFPRSVLIHDGLRTTVVDSLTKEPIPGAFVFSRRDKENHPKILARSDSRGMINVKPKRHLQFPLILGEGRIHINLWVCKEGYEPNPVVARGGGWNADYGPSQNHTIKTVELKKSLLEDISSCDPISSNPLS